MRDAIVIGARCAGATTALVLARRGLDVLLVDRAAFPSEIPHGHFIHQSGPARLAELGLLDRVLGTGCPPVTTITTDFGDGPLTGAASSRRRAARARSAPRPARPRARRGGSGGRRRGARAVRGRRARRRPRSRGRRPRTRGRRPAARHRARPPGDRRRRAQLRGRAGRRRPADRVGADADVLVLLVLERRARGRHPDRRAAAARAVAFQTNDDLTAIFLAWPIAELPQVRANLHGAFLAALEVVPELAERVRDGRREERFAGATQLPNFLRRPHGPGWALVGDAGCHKDPLLALGLCAALRDAFLLGGAAGA